MVLVRMLAFPRGIQEEHRHDFLNGKYSIAMVPSGMIVITDVQCK